MNRKPAFALFAACCAAAAGALLNLQSCAVNPVSGRQELALLSEEEEIRIGRESHAEILKQYGGAYHDLALQTYVQHVGERLAAKSHRSELVYRFTVLDSTQINAFALPGGYIYITRGLMAYLNSEAELAAVLGHEIGHVTARHSVRQISAQRATEIGYNIGSIFVPELRNQNVQNLFGLLNNALISGYGREHELEADRLGAEYLARGDYDPQAMLKVIGVLKEQEGFETQLAREEGREPHIYHGVFASHPRNDQRLQEVVAAADRFKTPETTRTNDEEYLHNIDGLVFGDGENEGIRRGNRFYHKELGFAVAFPQDWTIENLPNSIVSHPRDKSAVLQVQEEDVNKRITPEEFMLQRLKLKELTHGEDINPAGLEGYTAIAIVKTSYGVRATRFAVIYLQNRAFIFVGVAQDEVQPRKYDEEMLEAIRSFHPLKKEEMKLAEPLRLQLVRADEHTRFADLAKGSAIPHHPDEQLRMLNQLYPEGEPKTGQWIKIVK